MSEDADNVIWSKFVYICGLSGMMCITRATLAEIMDTPATLDMTRQVLREAEAVGKAKGVHLEPDLVDEILADMDAGKHDGWSSMRTDLDLGNRLEVGVINGAAARLGREVGVPTPANSFIAACLTIDHNRAAG